VFLIGRVLFGGYFTMMGMMHLIRLPMLAGYAASKGVPATGLLVALTGLQLLAGGLSMLLGVLPTVGAWLLVLFLVVVAFWMHNFWAVPDPMAKQMEQTNFLKNLALAGAALMISAMNPWTLSLWPNPWPLPPAP